MFKNDYLWFAYHFNYPYTVVIIQLCDILQPHHYLYIYVFITEQDIFGVDDQNRLLLLHREVFGEDELDLSRPMLKRHPRIRLHFGLSDAHMYLIKREVLEWSLTNM